MSESSLPGFNVLHERPHSFYRNFDRKGELQHQTHYCPGCGHGMVHKLLARAIDELGVQDRTVLISPVGCGVFAYYYFDVGNVQVAHGRAPAVATAVKRGRPNSIVVSYQGDDTAGMVGQQADAPQLEVSKNLGSDADVALRFALVLRQRGQGMILVEL